MAIDTSAGTSAAVLDGENALGFSVFDDPFGHAENIGLAISDALGQAGLQPRDISAVAIGRGPASYTGLRVGMAAGTTFANSLGIQLHGVMVLDAIAHAHSQAHARDQAHRNFYVIADAKRKELFIACYEAGIRSFGPAVIKPAELERFSDYQPVNSACDARLIGLYAHHALGLGIDLSAVSALYLRPADVAPSLGKKVSG